MLRVIVLHGNICHNFKRSDLMFFTTGYGNNMNAKIKTLS